MVAMRFPVKSSAWLLAVSNANTVEGGQIVKIGKKPKERLGIYGTQLTKVETGLPFRNSSVTGSSVL
jgi:hypothetical protein